MQNYDDADFKLDFDDEFEVGQQYKKDEQQAAQIEHNSRTNGIVLLYFLLVAFLVLFVVVLYVNITSHTRKLPTQRITRI